MIIAFYKVGNSKDYERNAFDNVYDNRDEIIRMLNELGDDELRVYDMDSKYDRRDFIEDFNDELLDNGWWCVEIPN